MQSLQFLRLTDKQIERFNALRSTEDMHTHGPLTVEQEVPLHGHQDVALYVVNGSAEFTDGEISARLGQGARLNAVIVPSGHLHGWKALIGLTVIEHTFNGSVEQVLAA